MIPRYSRPQRRKGFTLVELSIVLVIIGLLIGGILVAQSMISTTKIQAFIRQISQFDAAISNFETTYKALPGDNDYFGAVIGSEVHNDNILTDSSKNFWDNDSTYLSGEIGRFWSDLSNSGLQNESGSVYPDLSNGGVGVQAGVNVPSSKFDSKGEIVAQYATPVGGNGNFYYVDIFTPDSSGVLYPSSAYKAKDLLPINVKLDNGDPLTSKNVIITCWAGYALNNMCYLEVRMGIAVGQSENN